MSPRTFVSRGAALLALAAFGMAACESKTVVQPNPFPLQITVSPSSLSFTAAGQKAQLSASVTGGDAGQAAQGVNWASGNTAVATVDANGNVTAVANGTTTVIATSKAVATVSGAASVTVAITAPPPTQNIPPTITLAGLTNAAGVAIPANNVNGVVNIVMNIEPNNNKISKVQVKVGGTVACENTFTQAGVDGVVAQGADASTVVCTINTAALNANGTPVYPNGSVNITADLIGTNGASLASTSQTITLTNTSGLGVTVAGAKSATDPAGLLWQDSTVTVVVTPSIFTAGTQLQTITVSLTGVTTAQTKTVTNNQPVTFTFRADTAGGVGTSGVETAAMVATATSITTAGQNFQGGTTYTSSSIRYDNAGPSFTTQPNLTTLAPNGFMNAAGVLSLSKLNAVVTDGGVDAVTVTFQVSPNTSTRAFVTDTSVAQIGEQAANGVVLRIRACDTLGNCTNSSETATFGVDLTAPPINSVTADTLNPAGAAVTVSLGQDNLSGFDLTNGFVAVKIVKDSANASGTDITRCVNPATGALASITSSAPCNATLQTSTSVVVPAAAGNGYFTITVYAQDLAGNQTASTTKVSLRDQIGVEAVPTVSITSRGLTGNIPSVSASIKDNVELAGYQPFAVFAGAIGTTAVTTLPMAAATQVGTFGLPLTAVASPTATLPFGSIESGLGTAAVNQLAAVGFNAFDIAGNTPGLTTQALTTAGTGVTATNIASLAVAASPTTICQSGVTSAACTAPSPDVTATNTNLTATVTFNAATTTANPIVAVYFYAVNGTSAAFLGSATSAAFGVNTSNQRVFTFTANGAASAFPVTGANTVFAIGVDASGNGVFMGTAAVTTL